MRIARQNHYVPIWYQKGFILGPRNTLHYLDLDPPKIELPDGRIFIQKELKLRSPKQSFRERDLYTTRFGRILNDEIEKFLFGEIDTSGATAVRAFTGGKLQVIHDNFQRFFEYLNAQKLRTPKGLDWIKGRYPDLMQIDLMLELQHLRQMHCTMWVECVREIVSAEKSDVKFIVTDHPVTAYNPACAPTSSACQYPEEPAIDLKGTQTVFALDPDHCLILTNLEYAQDPTGVNLFAPRLNARYSSSTLARTDTMIRARMLTPDEVVSINSLLKRRSRQYLAAYEESWLFPEQAGSISWEDIGKILLPPSDMLGQFGGELYIGFEDGSTKYQDAFGRTDTRHEFLKKKALETEPAPNDLCGCGSGRRFKKCCSGVAIENRPPWDVYSIRDRNLIFCDAVVDILGLNKGKTWEDVRRELSNDQVKSVHEMMEMLWPKDTNIADLLPRPDRRVFRTVYMGFIDPRTIALSVISSLAYFDEIMILNPFPNPVYINPEFSPTQSPEQHKSQMLKNVSLLLALEPFIDAGLVHLVPDPMEFNTDFRHTMMAMAKGRGATWKMKREEMKQGERLARDDFERQILRMPEEQLRRWVLNRQPEIESELLESTIEHMKAKLANDPLALLQPIQAEKNSGEVQLFRMMTLEFALFIAHLTGAAIYTDEPACWRQLHEHASAPMHAGQHSRLEPITEKLANLTFEIETDPRINLEIRHAGKLGRMRRVFRRIWNEALTLDESADVDEIAEHLTTSLGNASLKAGIEWDTCAITTSLSARFRQRFELSAPEAGFSMNSVHRLLITSGRTNYIELVPIALFLELENVEDKGTA
ncbi:MAG: hypothetical protein F4X83_01315 [Chloroflexi bacterium]|nr:hypothetical protein [Chloroflexota bacterium]